MGMVTPCSQTFCAFAMVAMLGGLVKKPIMGEITLYSFLGGTEIMLRVSKEGYRHEV